MIDSLNKLIPHMHWPIILYALYGGYLLYDEHIVIFETAQSQRIELQSEVKRLEKKVAEIEEVQKRSDEYRQRVEQAAQNIEQVQKQLPADINEVSIMDYLSSKMKELNIKDPNFSAGKENPGQYSIGRDFTVKGSGTYLQFSVFFEQIANADRIYNMRSLKLSNSTGPSRGRFHMINMETVIEAYRYNPDFKVDKTL